MSTPTMVTFQTPVSSTDELPATSSAISSSNNESVEGQEPVPSGEVMPPKDPPSVAISIAA